MYNLESFLTNKPGLIAVVATWELLWKGIALWRASKNGQKYWFVAMLLLSTAGILPIVYLAFFGKASKN